MTLCVRLGPGANSDAVGGKARSLLALRAAGLPVPPAFVLTADLFTALRAGGPPLPPTVSTPDALAAIERARRAMLVAAWPAGVARELAAALRAIDPDPAARFSVRSSASIEDSAGALAPGLFLSRVDLPAPEVGEAVRAVLASALAPGAIAYLQVRGLDASALRMAVLLHPFVGGEAAGAAAFDPAATPTTIIDMRFGEADEALRARLTEALQKLGAERGPVEVEWVASGSAPTFLQLRPYDPGRRSPAPLAEPPPEGWRWDAAHNPLPLSPAQAGLVAYVDERCRIPFRQRVIGGYLFFRPDEVAASATTEAAASPAEASGGPAFGDELRALEALADQRLGGTLGEPAPIERALEDFAAIYERLFGVVQPAARAARTALGAWLGEHGLDAEPRLAALLADVPSSAGRRAELVRDFANASDEAGRSAARDVYLTWFGDEAPSWDLASPTWRDDPSALERRLRWTGARTGAADPSRRRTPDWRAVAAATRDQLPPAARAGWDDRLDAARAAAAAGEDDDALYARAQAHVRRALLAVGSRLRARGVLSATDEVFWLPLELVREDAAGGRPLTRESTARLLAEARRADAEARTRPPTQGRRTLPPGGAILRGSPGSPGVVLGRVRIWNGDDTDDSSVFAEVLVARTLLPTLLPLIRAAALVVETGGPLDHVAAQARERGLAAVVGAAGACARLRDGDQVLVDGDAGTVVLLDEPGAPKPPAATRRASSS